MGERLHVRLKGSNDNIDVCMGKLYGYLDITTKEGVEFVNTMPSISFLVKSGVLTGLFEDMEDFMDYTDSDNEKFEGSCYICQIIDFGQFFELTTLQMIEFVKLYLADYETVWGRPLESSDIDELYDLINNAPEDAIFEFSKGG